MSEDDIDPGVEHDVPDAAEGGQLESVGQEAQYRLAKHQLW